MNLFKLSLVTITMIIISLGCKILKPAALNSTKNQTKPSFNSSSEKTSVLQNELQDPLDIYFQAFLLIRKAEKTNNRKISMRYLEKANAHLQSIKCHFPKWKPELLAGRIEKTQDSIAELSSPDPRLNRPR